MAVSIPYVGRDQLSIRTRAVWFARGLGDFMKKILVAFSLLCFCMTLGLGVTGCTKKEKESDKGKEKGKKDEPGKKVDETKKVDEAKKVDEPKKVDDPKKADDPKKVDDPKKADDPKKVDAPKLELPKIDPPSKGVFLNPAEPRTYRPLEIAPIVSLRNSLIG
jgi:preprotein translocase subunit SecG